MSAPKVRVLLVEDDKEDAGLVVDILGDATRATFSVDVVDTAAAALEKVRRQRYDVLLLDFRLPDKNGVDLWRDIRGQHFRVPAILITSHGDTRLQHEALEAGFADYLEKGTFHGDLLARTCVYAIGLNERRLHHDTATAGVGTLVSELVDLTRDSSIAQERHAGEIAELRKDLSQGFGSLKEGITELKSQSDKNASTVLGELQKGTLDKVRETAEWAAAHPWLVLGALLAAAAALYGIVWAMGQVDPATIKAWREALLGSWGGFSDAPSA